MSVVETDPVAELSPDIADRGVLPALSSCHPPWHPALRP